MSCFHYTLRRRRLLADLHTPVHVYLNVRDLYTQSVLMESTDAQSRENSRSFIAFDPLASVAVSRGDVTLKFPDGSRRSGRIDADHSLADTLTGFLRAFHVEGDPAEGCGLYGYTSFDAVRYLEPIDVRSVDAGPYDAPEVCYVLFRYVVVFHPFDHSLDLIELLADGGEISKETDAPEQEKDFLMKFNALIASNISRSNLNSEMLAESMCLSKSQLNRKVKSITGINTAAYIKQSRLVHAQILLKDPERTIGDIVLMCGFESASYFTKMFKEKFGVTPSEYRKG